MEAKLVQANQVLEAADAQNKELSDKMQAVTRSLEEKCRVSAYEADQQMSTVQVGLQLDASPLLVQYFERALLHGVV